MNTTVRHFTELYTHVFFRVSSVKPAAGQQGNDWITRTLGKIGVVQHNCYVPEDFQYVMGLPLAEVERIHGTTGFHAIVRVVKEISPRSKSGILMLHPIKVLVKEDFQTLGDHAFSTDYRDGTAILKLNDSELDKNLLWSIDRETRQNLQERLQAHAVISDITSKVRHVCRTDEKMRKTVERSDTIVAYANR